MPKEEIEPIYRALLASGDLLEMFPDLTGEWSKDRRSFEQQYNINEQAIEGDLDFDSLDEY